MNNIGSERIQEKMLDACWSKEHPDAWDIVYPRSSHVDLGIEADAESVVTHKLLRQA